MGLDKEVNSFYIVVRNEWLIVDWFFIVLVFDLTAIMMNYWNRNEEPSVKFNLQKIFKITLDKAKMVY